MCLRHFFLEPQTGAREVVSQELPRHLPVMKCPAVDYEAAEKGTNRVELWAKAQLATRFLTLD
ncbi:hypothetical protein LC609_18875 [Nostoc sp. XA013]|nr:hypothetical protein [Nostoc sp. XA013]